MAGGPVTVLFTDLVSSTELLHRVGDEQALRVLRAHQRLLRDAVAVHGGQEVKWTGDGLMATFASSADAVRCAVAMQQTTRGRAAGERLAMRAGLHVGEVLRDESDWVGASVVVARRLCDRAAAGQILCSALVVELLGGRRALRFGEVGALELKGLATPVVAYEVHYDRDDPAAVLRHTPFTGRVAELARLERRFEEARGGRGGVAMVVGEPGIGKTRTLEEFAETARAAEAVVLWGRCYEGEAARPYGPFVEALTEYVRSASPEMLRADLGASGPPLGRLVPVLRERLPDLPEPVLLQPDEKRTRLIDAVTQFLLALAARAPTVLVLDDLHWADAGTVALLRHVARFASRGRLLVLGAYRDVEVDRQHPLAEALGTLPRETRYEHVGLAGLDRPAVQALLDTVAEAAVEPALAEAVARETSGNPFFIQEVLLHLLEEGVLARDATQWRAVLPAGTRVVPETVRQVIERRLGRVSPAARELLRVAAAFTAGVPFEVTRRVAGLEEGAALDALDEALGAQLLKPTADPDRFDFAHALVRHTLYEAQSPPRRLRLHRQIAEMMVAVYGPRASEHAAEIARHWHRSARLPGAESGVPFCLLAADQAQAAAAFAETVVHLRAALDLLPADAPEQPRLLARLGLALVWALHDEEAQRVVSEAMRRIAHTEDAPAAAIYACTVTIALIDAGFMSRAWEVAGEGLSYTAGQRDLTWALLTHADSMRREASDPDNPGMMLETPERSDIYRLLENLGILGPLAYWAKSREDLLARGADVPDSPLLVTFLGGELQRGPALWSEAATAALGRGQLAKAVAWLGQLGRCHLALGNFAEATAAHDRGMVLADRFSVPFQARLELAVVPNEHRLVRDTDWADALEELHEYGRGRREFYFYRAAFRSDTALLRARMGHVDEAMAGLAKTIPAIERAPGYALTYPAVICDAIEVSWLLERPDHVQALERNLRDKVLRPDFRWPLRDARLSMGRLCALQERYDEATQWFAKARAVLDGQGQRPLRAIVDYDEALMYARRDAPGDRERAAPLLDAALAQFRTLDVPGWIERAEALRTQCADVGAGRIETAAKTAVSSAQTGDATFDATSPTAALFRHEGDFWTLAYQGTVCRVKDAKGLHYIAYLLRHPGREFHVLELMGQGLESGGWRRVEESQRSETRDQRLETGQGLPILDGPAKAAYQQRLSALRDELDEAERDNDPGQADRARGGLEGSTEQLAAAVGLGGRDRQAASASERARSTVRKVVKAALNRIRDHHAVLGRHLTTSIKTGTFCAYAPDEPPTPWAF